MAFTAAHMKLLTLCLLVFVTLASASYQEERLLSGSLRYSRARTPEFGEGQSGTGSNSSTPASPTTGAAASTNQPPKPFDEAPTGTQDEVLAGEDWDGNRTVAESIEQGEMVYRSVPGGNAMPDPPADYYDDGDTEIETKVKAGVANTTVSDEDEEHLGHIVKKGAEDFYHKGLKPAGHWAFHDVLKPVGKGLGTAGKNTYEDVLKPAGEWTHKKVIKPSYDHAIKPAGEWTHKEVINPIGKAFGFDESVNPSMNMYGYGDGSSYQFADYGDSVPGYNGGVQASMGFPQAEAVQPYLNENAGVPTSNEYPKTFTPSFGIGPSALDQSQDQQMSHPEYDMGLMEESQPEAAIMPSENFQPLYPY